MIAMLDLSDVKDLAENGPFPVQIRCHNCNTCYDFDQAELGDIYARRNAG
jgi:molecular chaperone Hsp33